MLKGYAITLLCPKANVDLPDPLKLGQLDE